ncbi:disulfide bond formation protein B [Litorimonas sp. WD9-15]|uniref:disulfide bond formation protein B n=1 Tax=Litorimonas sp. WD9-15 TaxID=3418716 RepID=UPI003CFD8BA2
MMNTLRKLHSRRAAPWVALLVSGGLLGGAWVFQYGFGYLPCQMCFWQRHAHKAVIAISILAFLAQIFAVKTNELFRYAIVLAFLVSFGLAAWHTGVEFGIFPAPDTCAVGDVDAMPVIDPNDPLGFMDKSIKPPACSEAVWHFLGLSMAAWNALVSLIAAGWVATSKSR